MVGVLIVWSVVILVLFIILFSLLTDANAKYDKLMDELFGHGYEVGIVKDLRNEDKSRTKYFDDKISLLEKHLNIEIVEEETRKNGSIVERFYGYKEKPTAGVPAGEQKTSMYPIGIKFTDKEIFDILDKIAKSACDGIFEIKTDHKPKGAGNKKGAKK